MKFRSLLSRFGFGSLLAMSAVGFNGCGDPGLDEGAEGSDPDEIIGANAVGRNATIDSYVLVTPGASDDVIKQAIIQQLRPLFGALKAQDIGLGNRLDGRNAMSFIDATTFRRDTVNVIDPAHPETTVRQMLRVRFTYRDRAVVNNRLASRRAFPTTAPFGDYYSHSAELIQNCQSEKMDWGASGLWYNFEPHLSTCQNLIQAEATRISTQRRQLANADREITVDESTRWFTPISVKLSTISRVENRYPDYHRMYDDNRLVIGAFFGVDKLDDPNDYGAKNFFTYLRTILQARPELAVSAEPTTDLTTVTFNGTTIRNVTALRAANWIVDSTDLPTEVPYAMRSAFRQAVIRQWRDRTINLTSPATVTINGTAKSVTLNVRVFYGNEEGFGTGAIQRYKTAFRDVDLFQYTGHSHLGSGPLDARNYTSADFANQYQILMINSCVSFNYYNEFFTMHPGGSRNLDTVTNGLPVYLEGSGLSSARFATAFLDGRFRSYLDILQGMRLNLPWESNYDPNRVADGETDNVFTPATFRMTLTVPAASR